MCVLTCAAGNPSSVMSPAGPSSLEDQQYMEKLKQLSKYIEPLRRMINKIDKNEGELKPGHIGVLFGFMLSLLTVCVCVFEQTGRKI